MPLYNPASTVTDATISISDITTNDASTSAHGFLKKLDNVSTHFISGTGAWGTPAGTGAVASDPIWDAAGDLAQGTGADTGAKLSAGLAGKVLQSAGAAAALAWQYPPDYEFDYVAGTSDVTFTATVEASATTILTGGAVSYDGSTKVMVEFYAEALDVPASAASNYAVLYLFDGSSSIGAWAISLQANSTQIRIPVFVRRQLTPSNASHTYSVRAVVGASGTGTVRAGAGGAGATMPMYLRITKA